jgi:drug/metabolite transporter (DMT)-like permease
MPIMALTGWQLLLGGVPIVIGWWLWEPVPDLTALSLPSAIGLAYAVLVAMIFCQTTYFKIVTLVPANVAAMAVMGVPVVGVLSSAWILGEPVGPIEIAALVLVVGGLSVLVRR